MQFTPEERLNTQAFPLSPVISATARHELIQHSFNTSPQGLLPREQFGTSTPLYHRRNHNSRWQLFDVRLGTDSSAINDGPTPAR